MGDKSGGRRQSRGGRCGEAGASVYSQTGCFGILSPDWQEYWIWQTCFCILHTKKHGYTNTHPSPDCQTRPSRALSPWAHLLLNHGLIPSCTCCPPSAVHPSLSTFLYPPLFSFYFLSAPFPPSLSYPRSPLSLPLSLPPSSPPCLQDNGVINWPSWPTLLINSSRWGSRLFFPCCCVGITISRTRGDHKHWVIRIKFT